MATAAATLIGFADRFWWFAELFVHFRPTYLLLLSTLTVLLLAGRHFHAALAFTAVAALNLLPVGAYLRPSVPPPEPPGIELNVLSLNLHYSNRQTARVDAFLRQADVDLVLLIEFTRRWQETLGVLRSGRFPHQYLLPDETGGPFGLALLSRVPLDGVDTVYLGGSDIPALLARFRHGGRELQMLGVHTNWPLGPLVAAERNHQLQGIHTLARRRGAPLIVIGDLNVAPWSWHYQRLIADGELLDKPVEAGLYATWPSGFVPLGIAIDHCLVTPPLTILQRSTGPRVGSDHLPLQARIHIPSSGATSF